MQFKKIINQNLFVLLFNEIGNKVKTKKILIKIVIINFLTNKVFKNYLLNIVL